MRKINLRKQQIHNMKIGIVGAGIVGRLLALTLANAGWDVSIFDSDNEQGLTNCSMAAAGLLNPVNELEKCAPIILQLGLDSLQNIWPQIIQQIDPNIYFCNLGSLVIAHPQDQAEMQQFIRTISSRFQLSNLYHRLNQQELHHLEPELSKFSYGYHLPYAGQLDNQAIMVALNNKLHSMNHVRWNSNCFVDEIKPRQISCAKVIHQFDWVFDCRGLGSKTNFPSLRGVRGELLWLHAPDVHIKHPVRLMHPRYSIYLAPRPEQIYLLGASEIEAEDMSPISVRTSLELLSGVYYLHEGFAEARIIKSVVNCRPTLPDHLPKIRYTDGLVAINGLYRHGFLVTPALIDETFRLVTKGITSLRYPELTEQIT